MFLGSCHLRSRMPRSANALALALCVGGAAAFTAPPGLRFGRNSLARPLRAGAGVCQLQCAAGSEASVQRVGRKHMLQGAMSLLVVTAFGSEASAKKQKEKPCQPGLCVKASSPGIALDMIILMKVAKAMREAGEQVRLLRGVAWRADSHAPTILTPV